MTSKLLPLYYCWFMWKGKSKHREGELISFLLLLAFLVILFQLFSGGSGSSSKPPPTASTESLSASSLIVENGMTVKTSSGQIIVLRQINAPTGKECFADQATAYLTQMIAVSSSLELQFDKSLPSYHDGVAYGYLFSNNDNLNLEMVKQGAAVPYDPSGSQGQHWSLFSAAGHQAETSDLGIWATCRTYPPQQ